MFARQDGTEYKAAVMAKGLVRGAVGWGLGRVGAQLRAGGWRVCVCG